MSSSPFLRNAKLVAVTVAGALLVLVGLVLMVLPGPGIPLLIAGLAVLATEYAWARRPLERMRRAAAAATAKLRGKPERT
ncbi:MAG: PGPGW domain-containing protein [Acidimicrobiia bacterium]|nr:PGPGW domain-containing protein [Acidimicrobiia bacterium]